MVDTDIRYNRVAVFIDVDNLVIAADGAGLPFQLGPIVERIREEGQIIFVRAYGDWAQPHISPYLSEFRKHTIEMMQLATSATGKNTADVHLAVEALEMVLLPSPPDMIVVISGDRDFVPLVQKIKRYGKMVLGIGVKGSTSPDLANACNVFLFADDILGPCVGTAEQMPSETQRPEAAKTKTTPQRQSKSIPVQTVEDTKKSHRAFSILARAVDILARQGQQPLGSNVRLRMQQLSPTFYPERFGFPTFKDFVVAAEQAGFVRMIPSKQGDFAFDINFTAPSELVQALHDYESDEDYAPELNFDTTETSVKSYRLILQRYKRLELVPWDKRQTLVRQSWKLFQQNPSGMSLSALTDELRVYALNSRCWLEDKALQILIRTLCIARCFESDEGMCNYHNIQMKVRPAVDVEEALFLMNYTYVNGMRLALPGVPLMEEAVAILLFDEAFEVKRAEAAKVIARVSGGEMEPSNSLGDAFRRAKTSDEA